MLLEFIGRYYKYIWLALVSFAILKVVLSYSFHKNLQGVNGVLYALFKWYGQEEQELEDYEPRKTVMRFHNVITVTLYLFVFLLITVTVIQKLLSH